MTAEQIVSPDKIESELVHIWDSLQGTNKMRACLFNLIIYAKKGKRSDYLYDVAQKLIAKFPSRVIFITGEDNAESSYLKTSVSVLSAQEGENVIVCDYINIAFGGQDKIRIPFIILPNILPDLPLFLLWGDNPTQENPLTLQLEKWATRVIFDSETTDNLPLFASSLLQHKQLSICDIADLNWARIEGWRELIKEFFYSAERLQELKNASVIHIHYNAKETEFFCHTHIQAIYFQGWLATCLNWKLKHIQGGKDNLQFSYENDKGSPISCFLHPESVDILRPGRILSVEIATANEKTFSFKRSYKYPNQILIESATPDRCDMPIYYMMERDTSGQSLIREIFHKGTSSHYLDLLKYLKSIEHEKLC